ncbi:hypothetical protein FOXYSP1_17344 [Fusarium oxysporum f. sp. phaseoli]
MMCKLSMLSSVRRGNAFLKVVMRPSEKHYKRKYEVILQSWKGFDGIMN